ncbi:MAG: GAF domain-containing protein, partial [Bacteroidetes bacterium]|nr:GAF domain-containing protein [Bacteroidota bacterium]
MSTDYLKQELQHQMTEQECADFLEEFPFSSRLSFKPLLKYWEGRFKDARKNKDFLALGIEKRIKEIPELYEPVDDLSIVGKHHDIITLLMNAVFPPALKENSLVSANIPFNMTSIYSTTKWDELFNEIMQSCKMEDFSFMKVTKYIAANLVILKKFYNVDIEVAAPVIFKVHDDKTGLDRHFNIQVNPDFVDVVKLKKLKPLSKEDISELTSTAHDISLWREKIPVDAFEFQGFVVHTMIEVTDQEVLSALKDDLLEPDAITSPVKMKGIEQKIRSLLRLPELRVGLIAFNNDHDKSDSVGKIWNSILLSKKPSAEHLKGSLFEKLMVSLQPVLIDDLKKLKDPAWIEREILKKGFRNVAITPIVHDKKPIGVLALKLRGLVPMFGIAAKRSTDELQNRIQAVIKEKYTAIHPTVEWRFVNAAYNYLKEQDAGEEASLEPIVFKDLYPLYGQSDIRGSSEERSKSIQADLIEHLAISKKLINKAIIQKDLPIYDELKFRIEKYTKQIKKGLNSGDELGINEFIKLEIEGLFENLEKENPEFKKEIDRYYKSLDSEHGFLYKKRKDYEDSITKINETISAIIEEEEEIAQEKFPHYFEKYQTDGVEYNIYTGESLTRDGIFGPMYLRNMMLWQLMLMCEVANKAAEILPELKVPLETTHLILVYNTPLSIQFRIDEKQFDVEGAYNMRYEIVKKRIDKAHVKGTDERITQPGKIAIVYSQNKEKVEYMKYIDYLQAKG